MGIARCFCTILHALHPQSILTLCADEDADAAHSLSADMVTSLQSRCQVCCLNRQARLCAIELADGNQFEGWAAMGGQQQPVQPGHLQAH